MELRKNEITFMGHKISKFGLQVDPDKIKAVLEIPEPKNVEELRRFLGIENFLSKFIPNMTETA